MKNGKSNFGFSFHKYIANFEGFWGGKNFSKNHDHGYSDRIRPQLLLVNKTITKTAEGFFWKGSLKDWCCGKNLLLLRSVNSIRNWRNFSKNFKNLTEKGLKPCGLLKLHFYQILEHCQPGGFLLLSKKGSKEAENWEPVLRSTLYA